MKLWRFSLPFFTGKEADFPSEFWNFLGRCVYDLYPEELMDTIKKAYAEDLMDSGLIGIKDFELALEQGKEEFLEKYRVEQERTSMDDIHGRMSWWACFDRKIDVPRISISPKPKRKPKSNKKKNKKK